MNDEDKKYLDFLQTFDDLIDDLDQNDQAKLDDLIKQCGSYTKPVLCRIMASGQTLSEAIKSLELMLEILRERKNVKRRLAEENLINTARALMKRRLWLELQRISRNRPPTITETIFGM